MSELVKRLRAEGHDALAKHYSMGMYKLCADAADEIERLDAALVALKAAIKIYQFSPAGSVEQVHAARDLDDVMDATKPGEL